MKTLKLGSWRIPIVLASLACALLFGAASSGAQGGGLRIDWWTTAPGGTSQGGGGAYTLNSTVGQLDLATASGGVYKLEEGFLPADPEIIVAATYRAYLPLIGNGGGQ